MSGGHFNYDQHRLREAAHELQRIGRQLRGVSDTDDERGESNHKPGDYSPETAVLFENVAFVLHAATNLLHTADYVLCGDSGEEALKVAWELELQAFRAAFTPAEPDVEQQMRQEGWLPVREVLEGYRELPAFGVLNQIAGGGNVTVFDILDHYRTRPAFYHQETEELMEVGTWEELRKAVHGV